MSQEAAAPAAGAKKKSPLVLILVVVLVLGGGAGAGAFFFMKSKSAGAAEPPPVDPGIGALDPFVVNLADPGGQRFLRLTLRLVLESEEVAKHFEEDELARARVRSAILELLTMQTADHVVTAEGKAELKKEIVERGTHALEHAKVIDVLFTEFVVQY